MRYSFVISALFAATVIAAPAIKIVDEIAVVTVTVTAGTPAATKAAEAAAAAKASAAAASAAAAKAKAAPPAGFFEKPKPTTPAAAVVTPPPAPQFIEPTLPKPTPTSVASAPVKAPSSGGDDGSPLSGGVSVLSIANKWRGLYKLPLLTWSDSMAANSLQTGNNGGGVNEIHSLLANTNEGQIITPGQQTPTQSLEGDTPFELAFASWLCEVPSDGQLQASGNGIDQCALVKNVLNMQYADTGHHDIIVNPQYTQIGCAFAANPAANSQSTYQGLWVCGLDY